MEIMVNGNLKFMNKHFINKSISVIPDIPVDIDYMQWLGTSSNGFINTVTHTWIKDGEKPAELITSGRAVMLLNKETTGMVGNVLTGAGFVLKTEVADIEFEKKGDSFDAKQGIFYKTKEGVVKAKNFDTKVIWKAEEAANDGSAALMSAFGAVAIGVAALAF